MGFFAGILKVVVGAAAGLALPVVGAVVAVAVLSELGRDD